MDGYPRPVGQMLSTVHIAAPPEVVFDFVDDWRQATRYLRRLTGWELEDPEKPTGVGSVFRVGIDAGGKKLNGRLEVTEYVRPSVIAIRSIDGPRVVGGWKFSPEGDGTRVELRSSYDLPGGIAGRLVGAFVSRSAQGDLDASLRELKRLVETGGPGGRRSVAE